MKAVYYRPGRGPGRFGVRSALRAALEHSGLQIADHTDDPDATCSTLVSDIDLSTYRGAADVWITDLSGMRMSGEVGPPVSDELGIPHVIAEPDRQLAVSEDEAGIRKLFDGASHVVTTSSLTCRYIDRLSPGFVTQLPAFLDVDPFLAAHKVRDNHRSGLARSLGIRPESTWLLAHVSADPADSVDSLQLLAKALSRLVMMDWHLVVIGDDSHATRMSLVTLPRERIRYCERNSLPSFAALCASCDIYVWPAFDDASDGFVLEAQASGLAVIAGRNDVTEDQAIDGKTGRLLPAGNSESFANAISFLLRHPDMLRTFRENSREFMRLERGLAAGAAGIRDILEQLSSDTDA